MISPCIRRCTLDPVDNVCVGCGRTLAEIGAWSRYSESERRSIMEALPGRLAVRAARLAAATPIAEAR